MDNAQIFDLADRLKDAKDRKKDLEAKVKDLNAEIETLDHELSDLMAESECEKFSHSGNTFYLSSRLYASPQAGRKEDMLEALRDNGFGGLITETVNANTLAAFVKEQKMVNDDEIPDWLSDVVSAYEKVSVGIRKG